MSTTKKIIAASVATLTVGGSAVLLADSAEAGGSSSQRGRSTSISSAIGRITSGWDDVKTYKVDGSVSVRAYGMRSKGDVDVTVDQTMPDAPSAHLTASFMGNAQDVTVIDDTYYVKNGATYTKLTEAQMKAKVSILPSNLDAVAVLKKVRPQIESVRYLGKDRVSCQSALHYRFTVDANALEAVAGKDLPYVDRKSKDFTVDVWLDRENRMVKNAVTYQMRRGMTISYTGLITDIDEPVEIKAPA